MNDIVYGGECDMHRHCVCSANGGTNGGVIETRNCNQVDYIEVTSENGTSTRETIL